MFGHLQRYNLQSRPAVGVRVDFTCEGWFLVEHQASVATRGVLNEPYLGK